MILWIAVFLILGQKLVYNDPSKDVNIFRICFTQDIMQNDLKPINGLNL